MHKIKEILKKTFNLIFDVQNNIMFILSSSFLITAVIFILLALLSQENQNASTVFTYISAFLLSVWINLVQGADSAQKFIGGLARLCVFFIIFIFSLYNCLSYAIEYNPQNTIIIIFSSIGLLLCSIYFVSRLMNIISFVKRMFAQIKMKLFNTANPATSKAKALIENITAFLVAIGGLTVAIKVITESIFQVMDYFK